MNEPVEQYKDNVSLIEDIVEFHPNYLNDLSLEDRDVLSRYYFAGRNVDVDDLGEFRDELVVREPGIEVKALEALNRFKAAG